MSEITVHPLAPLNENYNPPRPWACVTRAEHDCTGNVIGAVGAYPVCVTGAEAVIAAHKAEEERRARLFADPEFQARLREEARIERWIETR